MTTPESQTRIQPLLIAAYGVFASGIILFIVLFVFSLPGYLFKTILILSISFAAFGTGELLNHPKQKLITRETVQTNQTTYHHNRNPCILGNLFDIIALLLLFIALSAFFFPH